MNVPRAGHQLVQYGDRLLAIGGTGSEGELLAENTIEELDANMTK